MRDHSRHEKNGILFLPSGPGLNSGPARLYLSDLFAETGKTVFWNEPSVQRDDSLPSDDGELWSGLLESLDRSAQALPERFVIVTESFGSLIAEALFTRMAKSGQASRVLGILHSPPVLDLWGAFRTVLNLGAKDFQDSGDTIRSSEMTELIRETDADPSINSPALLSGVALAFESAALLPRYFRSLETLGQWATGFNQPGFAPEPELRNRILNGMRKKGAATRTTFAPDVPTFVCGGATDPYQSLGGFEAAVESTRVIQRKNRVTWIPFPEAAHYPHVDAFPRWRTEVWTPFLAAIT
jgi:hypothetical protein